MKEEEEEDDTVGGRERGVYVCVTSAVEENCLTVIRRLLNDNLPSSLRWLPFFFFFLPSFPILSFLGREHFASLALRRVLEKKLTMRGDFHTWQSIFSTAI